VKKISNDNPDLVVIDWILNNICNYRCTYCPSVLHSGDHQTIRDEDFLEYFNLMDRETPDQQKKIIISGGEPTLHKNFIQLLSHINSEWYIQILTNGSRKISWWVDFLHQLQGRKIKIILSFHPEFSNPEHIFEVCKILSPEFDTTVQILMLPQKYEKCKDIFNKLNRSNLKVNVKYKAIRKIVEDNKAIEYNKFQKNIIITDKIERLDKIRPVKLLIDDIAQSYDAITKLIANKNNSFTDWICEFGQNRFYIWSDGEVTGASCATAKQKLVGDVKNMTFKRLKSTVCQNDYCGCVEDILIPKHER